MKTLYSDLKIGGGVLINYLSQENTGVIGVAGGNYVPYAPSGWWATNNSHKFYCMIQNIREKNQPKNLSNLTTPKKVFGLDGVFLAVKKTVFNQFRFNESLKGFHGYDIDFSWRIAQFYNNYVVNDVIIEHFSKGRIEKQWLNNIIEIRKNLGSNFGHPIEKNIELTASKDFLYRYFSFHAVSLRNILRTLEFYPVRKLSLKGHLSLMKFYFNFYKYKKYYNKRFINKL